MLWCTAKSFLLFPCLTPMIFVLQLPFERYLGFFLMEITFQYKKLDVAIWNFRNFLTVTVTMWVTLLFSISFLSVYLTIPYGKISFSFYECHDSSGPKCRDSFFYNHPAYKIVLYIEHNHCIVHRFLLSCIKNFQRIMIYFFHQASQAGTKFGYTFKEGRIALYNKNNHVIAQNSFC